jgi:phospholipid/cholesterol/gamma-HCH transport system substrate-binding protein
MELAIGATIIAGVIILIVMLMAWGNSSSILGRHYRLVVNMSNVGGLKEGAPVKMGGFQIGRVASIQIQPGGTDMEIVLDIDENRLLHRGSTAKVSTAGLVGDAFMEIIPGKSADMLKRASTVADAERLDSSPLPDLSELFTKVNAFGDQLTILTANLNDIVGDTEFRKSLKSMAVNIDAVSYQANLILQRGQVVVDNIELASRNVSDLSNTLKGSVEKVTDDVEKITASALDIADTAKETIVEVKGALGGVRETISTVKGAVEKATATVENINGGVTDARTAINNTIGNPKFADDLRKTIANINSVTGLIARRNESMDSLITNLDAVMANLKEVSAHVKGITGGLDPKTVPETLNSLTGAIASMTEVVDQIKKEPVLALSINKAADRIVKMKFDEMSKTPHLRTSDAVLDEINRWVRDSMERGRFLDPSYPANARPYVMDAGESAIPSRVRGSEQRAYLQEN